MSRLAAIPLLAFLAPAPSAQASVRAPEGALERHTVLATTLMDTPTREDPERSVAVYLPPSYATQPERRFPVLYLHHGIFDTERVWIRAWGDPGDPWGTIPRLMDRGIAAGRLAEMIVVMPDERTRGGGSFHTDSPVTGRWEEFTVFELVAWADETFRTLDTPGSRGIAGHSMGGYGALMAGMKHPDVFCAVYGMSPALLGWAGDFSLENPAFRMLSERADWSELGNFYERALITVGQAFSPAPDRPPFFLDMPARIDEHGEVVRTEAFARWQEHLPLFLAERYRDNLLRLRGLRFDTGTVDEYTHIPPTVRAFSERLTELDVPHVFEEYNGDHRNRLWGRTGRLYTEVLPWFSLLLEGEE